MERKGEEEGGEEEKEEEERDKLNLISNVCGEVAPITEKRARPWCRPQAHKANRNWAENQTSRSLYARFFVI